MNKKSTDRRVINSIGIGILAAITAVTPVFADEENLESTNTDLTYSENLQEENAVTQNAEVSEMLSDAQDAIQAAQDSLNTEQNNDESSGDVSGTGSGEVTEGIGENPGGESGDNILNPPTSTEPDLPQEESGDQMQTPSTPVESDTPQGGEINGSADNQESPANPTENEGVKPGETEAPDASEPSAEIDGYLQGSSEAIGNIENAVDDLDKKNAAAVEAIDNYNEAVANPNDYLGTLAGNVTNATQAVDTAADEAASNAAIAQEQAQAAVDAQAKEYENEQAAQAAKEQAQAAAAAAEEAYKQAQAAVEEAEKNMHDADMNFEFLREQKVAAESALDEKLKAVQSAKEALREILADNGFDHIEIDEVGNFDAENLTGDAKEAYINIKNALDVAQREFTDAQDRYNTAVKELGTAEERLADAKGKLEALIVAKEGEKVKLESGINKANTLLSELGTKLEKYKPKDSGEENSDISGTDDYKAVAEKVDEIEGIMKEAKDALAVAEDALKNAQKVKENADNVLAEAQIAFEAANENSELKNEVAETALQNAELAIQDNSANVLKATNTAKFAQELAVEAAEKAQEAANELAKAEIDADGAAKQLEDAERKCQDAQKEYNDLKAVCDAAQIALNEIQSVKLAEQMNVIEERQQALEDANFGNRSEAKKELAIELLRYQLLSEGKLIEKINFVANVPAGIIVVTYSEQENPDDLKTQTFSYDSLGDEGITVRQDLKQIISQKSANSIANSYRDQKENLVQEQNKLSQAKIDLDKAIATQNKAEIVNTLVQVAESLKEVNQEATNILEAEKGSESKVADVVTMLGNMIKGGSDVETKEEIRDKVENAYNKVNDAITALVTLTAQDDMDQSEYDRLLALYEDAEKEYNEALASLNKAQADQKTAETEKDRARAAADAIFSFISGEDTNPSTPTQPGTTDPSTPTQPGTTDPTTPTQPGTTNPTNPSQPGNNDADNNGSSNTTPVRPVSPIRPIYGTLIDTITSPVIGNTGVSTPSGTGYTYTIGGQPVYTVGETTAPEEEAAEELVNVEDSAVPLAAVGENNKNKTTNTKNTRAVSDEKIPLDDMKTENNKASWWWILVIALLGATGTEMYIRHKEKTEQERKSKAGKQSYAKI